jgi:hypothetical protein
MPPIPGYGMTIKHKSNIYDLNKNAQKTVSANISLFFQFAGYLSDSKNNVFQHLALNLSLLFTNISNIPPNLMKENTKNNFMLLPRERLQKFEAIQLLVAVNGINF